MRITLAVTVFCGALVVFSSAGLSREPPQKTSVCALYQHGDDYNGLRVTVTARLIVSTSTLQDQNCPEAHIALTLSRPPPDAACQLGPPTFGCPNDKREYIDGTFSGTFAASHAESQAQLVLEMMMTNFYSIQDAGP
jgi:hypothetical protein